MLARWLAGDLQEGDLEALRNLEGYPEYVEMLEALEGMSLPDFSNTLSWQQMKEKLAVEREQSSLDGTQSAVQSPHLSAPDIPLVEKAAAVTDIASAESRLSVEPPIEPVIAEPPKPQYPSPTIRRLVPWKMVAGIAAAVTLLIVGLWWVSDNGFGATPVAVTKAGEQKEVKLPDGSSVTLNAMSALTYSVDDWSNGRKVNLEGEAYFKAKKGKVFTVTTEQGTVEVVGTAFNVFARDKELEVKCTEGKVQVINPEGTERVLIKAGEQVSVLNGRMQRRQGLEFQPRWFNGESTFRSEPLEKVFGEMERQYGVVIMADSIEGRTFSGKFVNSDLEKALKMVCVPMKLKYSVVADTVKIF